MVACSSDKKLQGTWIAAYSEYKDLEENVKLPIRNVISFNQNQFKFKSFKYDFLYDKDFQKGNYDFFLNKLSLHTDTISSTLICSINNDSIVVKGNTRTNSIIYKRLADSLKNRSNNIKLAGKKFVRYSDNEIDTLDFKNDSIVYINDYQKLNSERNWERFKQDGFDIVFMNLDTPYIILEQKCKTILLTTFFTDKANIKLVSIE